MLPQYHQSPGIIFSATIPGIFAEETIRTDSFSMPLRHFHESLELYFLLEGERFYFVDQNTYHMKEGMAILINRNQIHKTSLAENHPHHHRFLMQIESERFTSLFQQLGFSDAETFGNQYCGPAVFEAEDWQLCCSLMQAIRSEMETLQKAPYSRPMSERLVALHTLDLLMLFAENRISTEASQWKHSAQNYMVNTGMHQKVHEIAVWLQHHCTEEISLEQLSEQFYISKSYLTRIFKSVTGFTIIEYINFQRVRKAQSLLLQSQLSVTDIAEQCGFGNVTYFERVFRQLAACSPMQYRKQN